MTDEKFYKISSWNNKKRIALQRVVAIMLMYAIILVCQWIHFEWWLRYDWACVLASLGYLLFIISIGYETQGVSIFSDWRQRIQDFADYSESPYFVNSLYYYYAPMRDGDYIVLSDNEYLKLDFSGVFYANDIDMNSLYSMKVSLMDGNNAKYEIKMLAYGYNNLLDELYRKIISDNLDVIAIYNKFGDLKWKKSEYVKKKSKLRKYRLIIYSVIWSITQFLVAMIPVLFMLYNNRDFFKLVDE